MMTDDQVRDLKELAQEYGAAIVCAGASMEEDAWIELLGFVHRLTESNYQRGHDDGEEYSREHGIG